MLHDMMYDMHAQGPLCIVSYRYQCLIGGMIQNLATYFPACSFFDALNARDIGGVLSLCSQDVVHEDLAHEQPCNERKVVMADIVCVGVYVCCGTR